MNSDYFKRYGADLIGNGYAQIADQALRSRERQIRELLEHRRLPVEGWDDLAVRLLLQQLAMADGNNQLHRVGVGEREGRVFSRIVAERNFHLIHGVGRSGDLTEPQPKAPGSSLLYGLTQRLAIHAVHLCGIKAASCCLVVPLATGLALSLCFSALRSLRPATARFVILSRIDQGSCVKSIYHAGFEAVIVHMRQHGDGLCTDLSAIEATVDYLEAENILCVVSTTSCFAPRQPDDVEALAKLCQEKNIPHIVNNAYGLQCSACCHRIEQGLRNGRVDAFVQSTDKNFMTPVGGALICSANAEFLKKVAATYPGRASASPILDLFITLLQMGQMGLRQLLIERKELHTWFNKELEQTCKKLGLRVLHVPANKISTAIDLSCLEQPLVEAHHHQLHERQQQEEQQQQQKGTKQRQLQCEQSQQHDKRKDVGEERPAKEEGRGQRQQQQDRRANECPPQEEGQRALSPELQQMQQLRQSVTPHREQQNKCGQKTSTEQRQDARLQRLGSFLFYRRCSGLRVVCCRFTASCHSLPSTFSSGAHTPHARQQEQKRWNQQPEQELETRSGTREVSTRFAGRCDTLLLLPLQRACASHFPSFSPQGLQCLSMLKHPPRDNNRILESSAAVAVSNRNTASHAAVLDFTRAVSPKDELTSASPATTHRIASGHSLGTAAEGTATAVADRRVPSPTLTVAADEECNVTVVASTSETRPAASVSPANDNCVANRGASGPDAVLSGVPASVAPAASPTMSGIAEAGGQCVAAAVADEARDAFVVNVAATYAAGAAEVSEPASFPTGAGPTDGEEPPPRQKKINGHVLSNWGSHCESYPVSYCTVAVAVGAPKIELETFLHRFELAVGDMHKKHRRCTDAKTNASTHHMW